MGFVGYAFLTFHSTPLLVYDTMLSIQPLTDTQRNVLVPALLDMYSPIIFGSALVVLIWTVFAVYLLHLLRSRTPRVAV